MRVQWKQSSATRNSTSLEQFAGKLNVALLCAKLLSSMLLRFRKQGGASALGALESDVMEAVWDASTPVTVADVHRVITAPQKKRDLAYSTVKAVLNNLCEKRHLRKIQQGRSNTFVPQQSREAFKERVVRDVFQSLLKDYRTPLLAHFVNDPDTDQESLRELKHLIEKRQRERRRE